MNIDIFLNQNFVRVSRFFVLGCTNHGNNGKRFEAKKMLFTKSHNQKLYCDHQWKKLL